MWSEGSIKLGSDIFHYWVKHYDEASVYGINKGRISKLMLKRGGDTVCNYDRGWGIKPADESTATALAILMKNYN